MSDINVDAISIIKSNLQDRYSSGFPVLKELLQNADDAPGTRRFSLDALPGWPEAENPLLQGPGLLVVNDGLFRAADAEAIRSLGASAKAGDSAAAGKFGFGQKAVFHLCDAFIVLAKDNDESTFADVLNPFLRAKAEGNVCELWEALSQDDLERLNEAVPAGFPARRFALWLPLRRERIAPAPGVGFSTLHPDIHQTLDELVQPDELGALLAALRQLTSIEIRHNGKIVFAVEVAEGSARMIGPAKYSGTKRFGGALQDHERKTTRFVGREVMTLDAGLAGLKSDRHWPQNIRALDAAPRPDKGEPHGAVLLSETRPGGQAQAGELRASWAVFLPVSETADITIPLGEGDPRLRLMMHGYFFVDSGRRQIEGLGDITPDSPPHDVASLRQTWNTRLRDTAVLPCLPGLLRDALDARMITSDALARLVAAISRNSWFSGRRLAIGAEQSLAQVIEGKTLVWRLLERDARLRPLPASASAEAVEQLFGGASAWAANRHLLLAVNPDAILSARPPRWSTEELGDLFASLSPRAFQSRDLARVLAEFLALIVVSGEDKRTVAPHLVRALRQAMTERANLAPAKSIESILGHVPRELLAPLPPSVEHREIFRALARSEASVLPVRGEWVPDAARSYPIAKVDLEALLRALEPWIEGHATSETSEVTSDQAASAALTLLGRAGHRLASLAHDPVFSGIKILRARRVGHHQTTALSLAKLEQEARAGHLFSTSPELNMLAPALARALPDVGPYVVEGRTAQLLRELGGDELRLRPHVHERLAAAVLSLVKSASTFGPDDARRDLLRHLQLTTANDRAALRQLCAGTKIATDNSVTLFAPGKISAGLDRVIEGLLQRHSASCLVTSTISDTLARDITQYVGIRELGLNELEEILTDSVEKFEILQPTREECEALLASDLSDKLLKSLPIHTRTSGERTSAHDAYRVDRWPIPASLRPHVTTIRIYSDPKAKDKQTRIVEPWSPLHQIALSLEQPDPARCWREILDALAELDAPPDDAVRNALKSTNWLPAGDLIFAPKDVLRLPKAVDEAARALLCVDGEPPYLPLTGLDVGAREHPGIANLQAWILPDEQTSFQTLALLIEDRSVVGRLGSAETWPLKDFAALAGEPTDLGLPGWPLLSACLEHLKEFDDALMMVSAFRAVEPAQTSLAAEHLTSLAAIASHGGVKRDAARRAYRAGFAIVASWDDAARQTVFGATRVLTRSGAWQLGASVAQEGQGLDPGHVLAPELAAALPDSARGSPDQRAAGPGVKTLERDTPGGGQAFPEVDIAILDARSADGIRDFLLPWRERIPPDLAIVFIGLLGRSSPFRDLAHSWAAGATAEVTSLWENLDAAFPKQILSPNTLEAEIDQRRFVVEPVRGETVEVVSIAGELFDAPVGGSDQGLLVGNRHTHPEGVRCAPGDVIRDKITLPLRSHDLHGVGLREAAALFRDLVQTIASDCLWLRSDAQQAALENILDRAVEVDQTTLEETINVLRDYLPYILAELKLPTETAAYGMLQAFQHAESRAHHLDGPENSIASIKQKLWNDILAGDVSEELLNAVRMKIHDYGYSADRVLFELFQNADDAYQQATSDPYEGCFRVEPLADGPAGFRIVHWGRPINHRGTDAIEGRRLGRDRDLLNMLLMNFSEKRPSEGLTGKFGLGFKSVHALSDSVGIASGYISLRIRGGFLPVPWHEGIEIGEGLKAPDGRKATVIEIPFSELTAQDGRDALEVFNKAATWAAVFARSVRRVEVDGNVTLCSHVDLNDGKGIGAVTISGATRERALRLELDEGFSLLLRVDDAGPCPFPDHVSRLWSLAPLEQELRSGWLLNGPFRIDPGRTGLAGSLDEQNDRFRGLGARLGARLVALHDLITTDWPALVDAVSLQAPEEHAKRMFMTRLFDIFVRDLDDDLAQHLHGPARGYGLLARERPVVPTHLPAPFDDLVRAVDAKRFVTGALAQDETLSAVKDWPSLQMFNGRLVSSRVMGQLQRLGFGGIAPLPLAELLRRQLKEQPNVDGALAARLARPFASEVLREPRYNDELEELRRIAGQARFMAQDGSWGPARLPYADAASDEEERRLCAVAPPSALLDTSYDAAALEFFRLARQRSGFGPSPSDFETWLPEIGGGDAQRQRAVMRYIVDGGQRTAVAAALKRSPPAWLPKTIDELQSSALLEEFTPDERARLCTSLFPEEAHRRIATPWTSNPPPTAHVARPAASLDTVLAWWNADAQQQRERSDTRAYPHGFHPRDLTWESDGDARVGWFTMLSLAIFRTIGRSQDVQHRNFVGTGLASGWLRDMATANLPADPTAWIERLEAFSKADAWRLEFPQWRRAMADMYAVARWLPDYVDAVHSLPAMVRKQGRISLSDAWRLSASPLWQIRGLEGAPLTQSLGIGANWLVRELVRHKVWSHDDAVVMHPYGWASTKRLRDLFQQQFGLVIGASADMDASPAIYEFVQQHLGAEADFLGDLDLPLQLAASGAHTDLWAGGHEAEEMDDDQEAEP